MLIFFSLTSATDADIDIGLLYCNGISFGVYYYISNMESAKITETQTGFY